MIIIIIIIMIVVKFRHPQNYKAASHDKKQFFVGCRLSPSLTNTQRSVIWKKVQATKKWTFFEILKNMGDLERSSSGNATVSEEKLDLKSIRVDSPGSSGIKTNRGRPRLSTPIKKARRKNTETERGKNRMSLRVGKDTFQRLNSFKDLHNFKTWDQTSRNCSKFILTYHQFPERRQLKKLKSPKQKATMKQKLSRMQIEIPCVVLS